MKPQPQRPRIGLSTAFFAAVVLVSPKVRANTDPVPNGGTQTSIFQQARFSALNTQRADLFGYAVAMDGDTLVVGAPRESSSFSGVNGTPNENKIASGAAYVFVRIGTNWVQQAFLKASYSAAYVEFGRAVAICGNTVVVGAEFESSNAVGINAPVSPGSGTQVDNSRTRSGAAYVFVRNGTTWTQQAYLKAHNPALNDYFGGSVSISGDTVAIGSKNQDVSGAVYVFARTGTTWTQQAFLKAQVAGRGDLFGTAVALHGNVLAIGAPGEDSNARGINGNPNNDSSIGSGAAYVFRRSGLAWTQEAFVKAHNTESSDQFGESVTVWGDTVVVGTVYEDNGGTGVNPPDVTYADLSGAAYVFARTSGVWAQQAYLKPSVIRPSDQFGCAVSLHGNLLAVGSRLEDNAVGGINPVNPVFQASASGATHIYVRNGTVWSHQAYLKAAVPTAEDSFGYGVSVSGNRVLCGAPNTVYSSGPLCWAYVFEGGGPAFPLDPDIALTGNGHAISSGHVTPSAADHTDFGQVPVNFGTRSRQFTIHNTGATLALSSLPNERVILSGSPAFRVASPPDSPVPLISGETSFALEFRPATPGIHHALVSIPNDDPDHVSAPFTFSIAGQADAVASPGALIRAGALVDGRVNISFQGMPGGVYRLQRSDNLTGLDWLTIGTLTADSNGAVSWVDTPPSGGKSWFYKMVIWSPE